MNAVALQDPRQNLQLELERLYDKNQLLPRIRAEFRDCKEINFAQYMKALEIPEAFGFDLLAHMAIRKRANLPTLVGCLRHHFKDSQATATMLEKAAMSDLVDYSSRDMQFIVRFTIDASLQAELDRFQYPLPMVIPPQPITNNLTSGYLTGKGSVILKDNHTNDDVCLDHLNRMNRTRFTINLDTAQTIQNKWKGLDKQKPDETWDDFQKRRKAFAKYDSVAKDVISLLVQEGNELYLTHKYDKRGRTYCMGFHITPQGTDWNKAVIELADKELLTGD